MRVGRNQIQAARIADLYGYLIKYHRDTVISGGVGRLRHVDHDSLIITQGKGFCHNAINESGNGIDYLTKYLGYSFQRAVVALADFGPVNDIPITYNGLRVPERATGAFKQAYAYLMARGIDSDLISALVHDDLIYQAAHNNNICFKADDFIELCGVLTDRRFKGIASGSAPDGYWHFGSGETAYVCESAIDAMSLYCLHSVQGKPAPAQYCSMAGLKQATLDRILKTYINVILCVDNDSAGDAFATANDGLERRVPQFKDWNEDLKEIKA